MVSTLSRRTFLGGAAAVAGAGVLRPRAASAAVADLDFAPAVDAARAIRRGDVSSVELTTRMLERIARHNPKLNAIVTLTGDAALARAKAADEARARREWWGPFHGVPCTIKDTLEVAGVRTTAGSPQYASHQPTRDAVAVARLRTAGAVLLGKTNVPPLAADWQSTNPVFGTTNNPWDVTRTPGGSTGGGAAALAAGLSFLEPGSDIGGSIRIPAHFCGVYGHKPTIGVVPQRGHIPPPPGLVSPPPILPVVGPLARSAADLLAAMEVLGGPDAEDARAYRWSLPPARGARLTEYRLGFVLDDPACPVASDVREVLARALDALRAAGVKLEEGWPAGVKPAEQYETYLTLLYSVFAIGLRDEQLEGLRQRAARQDGSHEARWAQAFTAPHRHYALANGRRMGMRAIWQSYFQTHDAFLMPTTFVAAFPHDHSVRMFDRQLATPEGPRIYSDMSFWISFATLTGLPATTAPVGLTRGNLPVGLQIVGPYLEDATPIDVAGRLADVLGGLPAAGGLRVKQYVLRRLALAIPTLFLVSVIVFGLMRLMPGDVATRMVEGHGYAKTLDALRHDLGLDRPVHVQYLEWIGNIALRGDFGRSYWTRQPILEEFVRRFPVTLELALLTILVSVVIGVVVGILSAVRQDSVSDYVGRILAILALSVPYFGLAVVVVVVPSIYFKWTPVWTYVSFTADPAQNLKIMLVPALVFGVTRAGPIMRIMRSALLDVLRQEYIRTAWSKGLSERTIVLRHALKNAMIPVISLIGLQMPLYIGGSVIIESIFRLPGVGLFFFEALGKLDYPVVQSVNLIIAAMVVGLNLAIDLSYAFLDPRIRYR